MRGEEFAPGIHVKEEDDEAVDAYVREGLGTVFHPVSTCRMGIDDRAVPTVDLDR